MLRRSACALLLLVATSLWAFKSFSFNPPKAFHAKTYPARDVHEDEKVAMAADPYDIADKTATVFHIKFNEHNFLPVYLLVSNDSDRPISIPELQALFITRKRVKIRPATADDVARRIARQVMQDARSPVPVTPQPPWPRKKKKAVSDDEMAEIQQAMFQTRVIDPHTTAAGFLFFDVEDIETPLAGASLDVSGVKDADGHELFYFSIPMEKYLSYQPGKSDSPPQPPSAPHL